MTLTSNVRSQSSSLISKTGVGVKIPALLTRMFDLREGGEDRGAPLGGADVPRHRLRAEARGGLAGARGVAAVDGHGGARLGQARRDRGADPARRAGDERGAPGEVDPHPSPPAASSAASTSVICTPARPCSRTEARSSQGVSLSVRIASVPPLSSTTPGSWLTGATSSEAADDEHHVGPASAWSKAASMASAGRCLAEQDHAALQLEAAGAQRGTPSSAASARATSSSTADPGVAAQADAAVERAVHLDQLLAAGACVQPVDVLGDDGLHDAAALELGHGLVGGVGLDGRRAGRCAGGGSPRSAPARRRNTERSRPPSGRTPSRPLRRSGSRGCRSRWRRRRRSGRPRARRRPAAGEILGRLRHPGERY